MSSNKVKVTFIHPDLGIGGAERLVLDIAVALADQGNQVEFITNHFDKNHSFEELKSGRYPVRVIGDWLPTSLCGKCTALCTYIRMLYLTIVYVLFSYNEKSNLYFVDQIPMAVPILKFTGRRVVYYCHHPDLLASSRGGCFKKIYRTPINWLERFGTNKADLILVNSKYTANVFRTVFPQIKHNLTILYPSISSTFVDDIISTEKKPIANLITEADNIDPNNIIFLSINRFHPAKQLTLAIKAIHELQQTSPETYKTINLVIAGGYDPVSAINKKYFKELTQLAHELNVADKVLFVKSPSDKLKAHLLKACNCVLYTPVNEHFGIVPLEAMAASKPVIACNSGGPLETVEHGSTGYLCEPEPEAMASFMAKMVDVNLATKLGHNGFIRMQRHFSNETFSKQCAGIVNEVCKVDSE